MLNLHVRVPLQRVLGPLGQRLARSGVNPDVITVIGTVGVVGAALGFYPRGSLFLGSLIVTVFVLLDMVDGALARARGITSPWGAFLDSTLDRVADAAIFSGLVWWFASGGDEPILAGVALYCLVSGVIVSYAKARAEGLGMRCDVGLAERSERLIVILTATGIAGLGVPFIQAIGLWLLAAAATWTVGQRFVTVYRQSHDVKGPPA
jgi:CDP-diacylglycerol--glycerol-3-phosphate 3-phosphatidyltransferase